MLRTVSSFLVAAALSSLALLLGPILDRLPSPPEGEPAHPAQPTLPSTPSRATADGLLQLTGALSGSHLLQNGDGSITLVADVRASRLDGAQAPPLDLALVIDRSGSMAGPKLGAAKKAAKSLIDRARPSDRVTLIAYGSTVTLLARNVPATRGGKIELLEAVNRIEDFGGTFISGALEAAARAIGGSSPDRLRRVILLSDGEANEGITSRRGLTRLAARLSQQGITISSVGIGVDFDEDTMLALADASGGRYTYVRGPADLTGVLSGELLAASKTVAREVILRIRPLGAARVDTVYGYTVAGRSGEVWVRLRDLESEGRARVVVALVAPSRISGNVPVAELTLQYLPADRDLIAPAGGGPTTQSLILGITVTPDRASVERGRDTHVLAAGARAYAAEGLDRASRLYADGQRAEASRVLRQRLEEVMLENTQTIGSGELARDLQQIKADAAFETTSASSLRGKDMVKRLKSRAVRMAR